jgi:methylmalonyl-CoA/ethylmalonyl-CoA epimerase
MKIDHIGIIVHDIEVALNVYEAALGLPLKEVTEVPDQKVRVAFLPIGESNLELVQPTSDDTGTAKFLAKRGEGIHHICIEVPDIEAAVARLKEYGVQLIDQEPRQGAHGRVAFIHPKGAHGVLVELVEHEKA